MNAGRAFAFVISLSLASSVALAEDPSPAEKKAAAAREAPAPPAPKGLVVFVDPVTGKIRQPEPAEIGALVAPPAAVALPAGAPLLTMSLPGGGVAIRLDSSFESYTVMTKAPDGNLVMTCVTGEKEAKKAVASAPAAAPTGHKREPADVP